MGLTDEQWEVLAPLIEACRPAAKVPPRHLRRKRPPHPLTGSGGTGLLH